MPICSSSFLLFSKAREKCLSYVSNFTLNKISETFLRISNKNLKEGKKKNRGGKEEELKAITMTKTKQVRRLILFRHLQQEIQTSVSEQGSLAFGLDREEKTN